MYVQSFNALIQAIKNAMTDSTKNIIVFLNNVSIYSGPVDALPENIINANEKYQVRSFF